MQRSAVISLQCQPCLEDRTCCSTPSSLVHIHVVAVLVKFSFILKTYFFGPSCGLLFRLSLQTMPSEVQFIVSDGNLSIEVKRAHRRLVRSHVTAQRYQQKRERDAKAYEQARQKAQITTPFPPGSSPGQSGEHPTVIESSEGPNAMGYRSSNPNVMVDRSPRRPDNNNAKSPQLQGRNYAGNDDLKLEKDGGHLIAVDFAPSPFAYVGNGLSDPFVRIPPIFSPRMGKHMFYCEHLTPHSLTHH